MMLASTCQEVMPERASGEVMRRKIAGGSEAATQEAKESQTANAGQSLPEAEASHLRWPVFASQRPVPLRGQKEPLG
ncbi:hypothetical protein Y697_07435 [Mesotoga sp. BH458_6_3_2_1]|nr:hypothetical protein Y697_07435 [Mesotoga sp. BH458_6_3_2_1]